ncbi:MAG: ubiquinol-cytochrome c reductase iron-sulfur subunit [Gemmatimonadaceae bacterium]
MSLSDKVAGAPPTQLDGESCEECTARVAHLNGAPNGASVDRREFVTRGALAAVGALLASACGGGGGGNVTGPGNPGGGLKGSFSVQVSSFPALTSVGGIARVDSGQSTPVAAVRTSDTAFAAFSLICPHFGCTVGITTGSFVCPCHGARFAANGHWTGGQPTGNLSAYNTSYDAATGMLTITS